MPRGFGRRVCRSWWSRAGLGVRSLGPLRVRVEQCAAALRVELVYHQLVCDGATFGPGATAKAYWAAHASRPTWTIDVV